VILQVMLQPMTCALHGKSVFQVFDPGTRLVFGVTESLCPR